MKSPLLSIIIPIYNVRNYVLNSLNSLFIQIDNYNINQIEIILINDGTQDDSIELIDHLLIKYSSIIVYINQVNQGLSSARNAGLKNASGTWVWFFDSDDTAVEDSLNSLVESLSSIEYEVLAFDLILEEEATGVKRQQSNDISLYGSYSEPYKYLVNGGLTSPIQRFIFQREFLLKNNLTFYPNIYHEDIEFMLRFIPLCKSLQVFNVAYYNYLLRKSGSITSTFSKRRIDSYFLIFDELLNHIDRFKETDLGDFYISRLNIYVLIVLDLLKRCESREMAERYLLALHKKVKSLLLFRYRKTKVYYSLNRTIIILIFKIRPKIGFTLFNSLR